MGPAAFRSENDMLLNVTGGLDLDELLGTS